MVVRQLPRGRDDAVLDPERVVLVQPQRSAELRVLDMLVGRALGAHQPELGLVEFEVLQRGNRFDDLPAGAQVMEFRPRQRHHRRAERLDLRVTHHGRAAQREAELIVKPIPARAATGKDTGPGVPATAPQQERHRARAQQP
jgi:hypothetical protein